MDLHLSSEQQLLIDAARKLLSRACPIALVRAMERDVLGYDRSLWRTIAEMGWLRGDVDRSEQSLLDVVLLLEEMGRVLLPAPFVETVVLAAPLLAAQRAVRDWCDSIAAGEVVATVGLLERDGHDEWKAPTLQARSAAAGVVLDGCKELVPYARGADVIVVSARRDDGVTVLVAVDGSAAGVTYVKRDTVHGVPMYDVGVHRVALTPDRILAVGSAAEELIAAARARAAVASLAFMVGAAEQVLAMTIDYAKTRTQFERPIGSFQAIAHRCVEMRSDIDALRLLVYHAAWQIGRGMDRTLAVSAAKAYGNEALRRIFMHAHQVHGAIGFSTEHDLHLFTRRAKAAELLWGSTALHLEQVATAMGL